MLLPAKNSKANGFTLIEVMMAMLIMTVGLMGLLQTLGYAIAHNSSNKKRNDAIMIADRAMMHERVKPFASIFSSNSAARVPFALGFVNYSVNKTVDPLGSTSKRVQFDVVWREKQVRKHHYLTTIIGD